MLRPRPKTRSLQRGSVPVADKTQQDPNASSDFANYHRANVAGYSGAMPSETYQYDVVFDAFRADEEFWINWHVVDCARNDPNMSISQDNACIRVVMNLTSSQKLYPTAYTPGFPTLPCHAVRTNAPKLGDTVRVKTSATHRQGQIGRLRAFDKDDLPIVHFDDGTDDGTTYTCKPTDIELVPAKVAGLPPGYSVALDVHILEDSRVMLDFKRRQGKIDKKYLWLDAIVAKADLCLIFGLPLRSNDKNQRGEGEMITIQRFDGRLKAPECRTRGQSLFPEKRSRREAHELIAHYAKVHVAQQGGTEEDGAPLSDFIDGLLRQRSINWASGEDARGHTSEAKQKAATQQAIAELRPSKQMQAFAINFPHNLDNVLTYAKEEDNSQPEDIEEEDSSHRQYRCTIESFSEKYLGCVPLYL